MSRRRYFGRGSGGCGWPGAVPRHQPEAARDQLRQREPEEPQPKAPRHSAPTASRCLAHDAQDLFGERGRDRAPEEPELRAPRGLEDPLGPDLRAALAEEAIPRAAQRAKRVRGEEAEPDPALPADVARHRPFAGLGPSVTPGVARPHGLALR